MIRSLSALVCFVLVTAGGSLGAQARPQPQEPKPQVPRTHLPPPGLCRIWLDNVPTSQQPAPTDCASAVRNLPRNGRVVFSEEPRNSQRLPMVKSLKEPDASRKPADAPPAPTKTGPDGKPIIKPVRPDSES